MKTHGSKPAARPPAIAATVKAFANTIATITRLPPQPAPTRHSIRAAAVSRASGQRDAAEEAAARAAAQMEEARSGLEAARRDWRVERDALSASRDEAEDAMRPASAAAAVAALRVEAGVLGVQAAALRRYAGAYVSRRHRSAAATAGFRELCALMPHLSEAVCAGVAPG